MNINGTTTYRFRRGFNGVAVLQRKHESPVYIGGSVDSSRVKIEWIDEKYDNLSFSTLYCQKTKK